MEKKSVKKLIEDYLNEAKLMQIATVKNGKPWVASVWYAHDKNWNLYFISRKNRRHSIELKNDPNVAGAIVKPHLVGSGEKVRGLQFEGTARACNGTELKIARDLYLKKYPTAEKISLTLLKLASFIATFYVVHPKTFVLFDEINFPKNPRQEFSLR
jgi:uncharacterized protein YhbP (UPF0306 family)